MKMDKRVDADGEKSPPRFDEVNARQNVTDALNEILDMFTNRTTDGSPNTNGHSENVHVQPQSNPSMGSIHGSLGIVDGIDPSSPLGRSLQVKFSELEEISRRLKSRLNQVICDQILLSPDADADADVNATDLDLERDLNTDSHAEDLTPQEFLQLVQSQMDGASQHSFDNSEKSDDISK